MALFPKFAPDYNDEKDRDILSTMEDFYRESLAINQYFWAEADIDHRYEAGDQTLWGDMYGALPGSRQKTFNFNRIRRLINMVTGHQRKNRKSTIAIPRENADQATADQLSKLLSWVNDNDNILETESDAFHGALITGLNLLQVWVDYRDDPISGDIKVDNCSYNNFMIDPFFKKKDLSDCNGIWKRSYLTNRECASLLPEHAEEILALSNSSVHDGKFNHTPEAISFNSSHLLTYDEYYYKAYREKILLIDTETEETLEWTGYDDDKLEQFLAMYPNITTEKLDVPTINLAIVVQGKVMYNDRNPMELDVYPFVPVFGYYTPQIPSYNLRIQGIVRGLRDAQYLYNRRKITELNIFESQPNSGYIVKENALVDKRDVFKKGEGTSIFLKASAQMSDIVKMQAPAIDASMIQVTESFGREVQEISGINEELLGMAQDDKAGVLAMLRQGAGLTTLQVLFDQLDYSQKLLGDIIIKVVQNNFTSGKIRRILEEEPTQQFFNKAFGKYDAVIEEGLNTSTQRQMQFAQLLQLREAGVPIPDDVIIEAATVQNKEDLKKAIEEGNKQKAEAEQIQMQAAVQEQQARTELAQARAIADRGLGAERVSRIEENQMMAVERSAEAQKDRMAGTLDLVKAMKELEDIDIRQLREIITLSHLMNKEEQANNQETVQGVGMQNKVSLQDNLNGMMQ